MSELFKITFKKKKVEFTDTTLTFSLGHVKSREVSTLYFNLKLFNFDNTLIHTYTSDRWVISSAYTTKHTTFNIPSEVVNTALYMQIELVGVGISSENPLYFNEVMLNEGEYVGYHSNSEKNESVKIKFNKSSYAILYNRDGKSLQVIRPSHGDIFTDKITASEITVLAPHLENEPLEDDDVNLFFEYMNQREQKIDILR